jgi:hypothetical protein
MVTNEKTRFFSDSILGKRISDIFKNVRNQKTCQRFEKFFSIVFIKEDLSRQYFIFLYRIEDENK